MTFCQLRTVRAIYFKNCNKEVFEYNIKTVTGIDIVSVDDKFEPCCNYIFTK